VFDRQGIEIVGAKLKSRRRTGDVACRNYFRS
jgi:hypothetical protein